MIISLCRFVWILNYIDLIHIWYVVSVLSSGAEQVFDVDLVCYVNLINYESFKKFIEIQDQFKRLGQNIDSTYPIRD